MPDEMTPAAPAEAAAPPMTPPNAMMPPGPTGQATMAPNRQGNRLQGMVIANIGITMLDKALAMLGSQSEEGQVVVQMLNLARKIGKGSQDKSLNPAEMKLMGAQQQPMGGPLGMGGPGGGPGAAVKQRLAALGMGGGPQGA